MSAAGPSKREKKRQQMLIDPAELPNYIKASLLSTKDKQKTIDYLENTYNVPPPQTLEAMEKMKVWAATVYSAYIDGELYKLQKVLELHIALFGTTDPNPNPLVHRYIVFCIQCMMTKQETIQFLAAKCNVDEALTRTEWNKLRREKRKLFRNYYKKMEIMKQREMSRDHDTDSSSSCSNRADDDDDDDDAESALRPYNGDEAPSNIQCCIVKSRKKCSGRTMGPNK